MSNWTHTDGQTAPWTRNGLVVYRLWVNHRRLVAVPHGSKGAGLAM